MEITEEDFELGYITYEEKPDYLLDPTSKATYKYDSNGNRINYVTDNEAQDYEYDAADRLLADGNDSYSYDANGNMTGVQAGEDTVEYIYNAANKLTEVRYPDGTYVKYGYDAFGRKVSREEAYWNKEADAPGKSEYAPGQNKEKNNNGKGNDRGNKKEKVNPLKLRTDTTTYLYDGFTNAITNEYTGNGSPLSQYYMANDRVVSKKTFGNHGLVIPGREPALKTNGGLMYYSYDGMRNVTELTDRHGDSIEKYRYDAFGGLYTGITAPYNTNGFAGKSYDVKANLIDNNARWYQAQNGRFTTADPYTGDILTPYTQNRYAYVGNNPINRWDPLGYWMAGDENLSAKARSKIAEYEKEYYAATTDEGKADAHAKAEVVRAKDRDRWTNSSESIIKEWDIDGKKTSTQKKVSDGWQIYWRQPGTNYKEVKITEVLYTAYAGAISESTRYETRQKAYTNTWEQFKPFTAQEWYQENKALLKEYKIPISQANTLYEPKEAYSTKLKTTYGKTTTIPYLSERTGNNTTKLRLLQEDLYDSCGGSKPNVPSAPVNTTGNLDIMTRISSIAGGSIMTYVGAIAIITGATALTIATGGAGLPALIAATVAAGTMISGAGLAVMGVNEIAYGATGENVLLNNVFKGNTYLYSNTQLALTMGAIGGTQYSSAYSYQETVFRNEYERTANTAYRYVSEGEKAFIEKNGYIPNVGMNLKAKDIFVSPNKFTSISDAESALQIGTKNPLGVTQSPLYRVDFNMNAVNYRYAGNVEGGTGIEMITEQRIPVNPNSIYPLGK